MWKQSVTMLFTEASVPWRKLSKPSTTCAEVVHWLSGIGGAVKDVKKRYTQIISAYLA